MVTDVERRGVRYRVIRDYGQIVWERFIPFGRARAHIAGGSAFREAAREQDIVALAEHRAMERGDRA